MNANFQKCQNLDDCGNGCLFVKDNAWETQVKRRPHGIGENLERKPSLMALCFDDREGNVCLHEREMRKIRLEFRTRDTRNFVTGGTCTIMNLRGKSFLFYNNNCVIWKGNLPVHLTLFQFQMEIDRNEVRRCHLPSVLLIFDESDQF